MARKPLTKREQILKAAGKRKRGVEVTALAEEVDCSTSYVRLVLRDAGFAPTKKATKRDPVWAK